MDNIEKNRVANNGLLWASSWRVVEPGPKKNVFPYADFRFITTEDNQFKLSISIIHEAEKCEYRVNILLVDEKNIFNTIESMLQTYKPKLAALNWTNCVSSSFSKINQLFLFYLFKLFKFFLINQKNLPIYMCTERAQADFLSLSTFNLAQLYGYSLTGFCKAIWQEHPSYPLYYLDNSNPEKKNSAEVLALAPVGKSPLLVFHDHSFYVPHIHSYFITKKNTHPLFLDNATYLITGGAGGVGQVLLEFLVAHGAKHILIASRNPDKTKLPKIENVEINWIKLDITQPEQVTAFFQEINTTRINLKGVFHLAGVLNDKDFLAMNENDFNSVWMTKAQGAWLLYENIMPRQLDYFVMFSSVTSLVGQEKQTNYATANAFLDGLIKFRQDGLSIQWGPWKNVGMTKNQTLLLNYAAARGVTPVTPELAKTLLPELFSENKGVISVGEVKWDQFCRTNANKKWPNCLLINEATTAKPNFSPKIQHISLNLSGANASCYSPLSMQQLQIWKYAHASKEASTYYMAVAWRINGVLDIARLQHVFISVFSLHDLLRATFLSINNQPVLKINKTCAINFSVVEMDESDASKFMLEELSKPFDLNEVAYKLYYLIDQGKKNSFIYMIFHHLIADSYSVKKIFQQITKTYNNDIKSQSYPSYVEFTTKQWEFYKSKEYYSSIEHIKQGCKKWYTRNVDSAKTKKEVSALKARIKESQYENLQAAIKNAKISSGLIYLAVVVKTLAHHFHSDFVSLVLIFSGRESNLKFAHVFGDTSNDVLLAVQLEKDEPIAPLAKKISYKIEEIKKHAYVLLEDLKSSGVEIPKISFDSQNLESTFSPIDGHDVKLMDIDFKVHAWGSDPRHLSFKFFQYKNRLDVLLKYRTDIYSEQEATAIFNHTVALLNSFVNES